MQPAALESWLAETDDRLDRVKAVMPIHLYGQCADMIPILDALRPHGIAVIEDAAQAIGAAYPVDGELKKAGSMGTFGCFSFFPSKNLGGVGDGGMVVTDDTELDDKLRRLRNHGAQPKYYHAMIGGNFRLDPIQAAVLLVKLRHLEDWHAKRQANAAYYDRHLEVPGIKKPAIAYDRKHHIYNQYVLSVPERRDELRAFLTEQGIGSEVYYPVAFHEQQCFEYLGCRIGQFPNSEHAARHTIALPIYPDLTTEMQDYVIQKIGEFYG
jgi:dTDP-4-amino-4,6-dideoxygalactose transaminase